MKIILVLAAVAALAPAAASADTCFRTRDISNHRKADNHTLYMRVGLKDVYRIGSKGACLAGATSNDALMVGAPPSGLVCSPVAFDLGVRQGGHVTPCIVDSIVKLTPQQVAALPKGSRP